MQGCGQHVAWLPSPRHWDNRRQVGMAPTNVLRWLAAAHTVSWTTVAQPGHSCSKVGCMLLVKVPRGRCPGAAGADTAGDCCVAGPCRAAAKVITW
jgi:hypothetical protein